MVGGQSIFRLQPKDGVILVTFSNTVKCNVSLQNPIFTVAAAFYAVGLACDTKSNPTQSQIGPTPRPLSWSAIGAVRRLLATKGQPITALVVSYHKAGKGGSYAKWRRNADNNRRK